jgi:hypothetical protein
LIFFIFWSSKICVNLTGVLFSLSPPQQCLSLGRHRHSATPCHVSFPWSQDELVASGSSTCNASSRLLPSRAKTEALNPHHWRQPSSLYRLTYTLHCYKKFISTLTTPPTTHLHLHFASSLARAPCHRSSTHRRRSLSLPSHTHRPFAQRHPQ